MRGHHHRHAGPLHRRLFLWFGVTIVLTVVSTAGVAWVVSPERGAYWTRERNRVTTFLGGRFAAVWKDSAAREELRGALARDLEADVRVVLPGESGPHECRRPFTTPVVVSGAEVGTVEICFQRRSSGWLMALPLGVAVIVLWAASGRIARRLARPLRELARVSRELGDGNLAARADVRCGHPEEIRALGATFNEMASRIERQVAGQRELLAGVSHELRTPLQRIELLVALAESEPDPEKRARHVREIEGEIRDVDALVGELLAASRLDFSVLDRHDLDAAQVAARALERADVDPTVLSVETERRAFSADPTLIQRALGNLIDNAKKYGGGVAELHVFRPDEERLVFEVRDRGPGFAPGDEEQVFEAFVRRVDQPEAGTSLGLGLALVKRIAEAHGGRARARNADEGGGAVALELPT